MKVSKVKKMCVARNDSEELRQRREMHQRRSSRREEEK
jgi:hypothetical protein